MEYKCRHLEMIQEIIKRMAANSFTLKGWTVTIIAGILTLSANVISYSEIFLIGIPIILFWGLDSYYLMQEKRFRNLYDNVLKKKEEEVDFSMEMPSMPTDELLKMYWTHVFSITEIAFYIPLVIISVITICLLQ